MSMTMKEWRESFECMTREQRHTVLDAISDLECWGEFRDNFKDTGIFNLKDLGENVCSYMEAA